jgi:hypothetical protein
MTDYVRTGCLDAQMKKFGLFASGLLWEPYRAVEIIQINAYQFKGVIVMNTRKHSLALSLGTVILASTALTACSGTPFAAKDADATAHAKPADGKCGAKMDGKCGAKMEAKCGAKMDGKCGAKMEAKCGAKMDGKCGAKQGV